MVLAVISWILTGLVVGAVARLLVPGRQSIGLPLTIVLGVVGAFIGGLLSSAIWPIPEGDPDASRLWPGWLMSIVCATLVLWAYVALAGRRTAVPNRT
jgi:uncharacterized membrane protein YeaQ/YmgE (transglycosylase-associated protein family)